MNKAGIVLCSILLFFSASANFYEFDNYIEYEPSSLPYPYQTVEQAPPVYKNSHAKFVVPASTEVIEVVEPPGFISTAISCTFNAVKSVVVFFIKHAAGLIVGIVGALGLCKLTSLCDSKITIYEAETELRSLATPERLTRAVNFVKEAVKKYNEMQNI